jgi:hypothetical protein
MFFLLLPPEDGIVGSNLTWRTDVFSHFSVFMFSYIGRKFMMGLPTSKGVVINA